MNAKDVFLAPIFLFVIAIFLLASRAPEAAPGSSAAQLVGGDRDPHYEGVIVDWRLDKDGTVFILLEGRDAAPARVTGGRTREAGTTRRETEIERWWFKTPPIQGQQVHFQDLVMFTILHTQERDFRLTIWGDTRPTARGETLDGAITIDRIGPG